MAELVAIRLKYSIKHPVGANNVSRQCYTCTRVNSGILCSFICVRWPNKESRNLKDLNSKRSMIDFVVHNKRLIKYVKDTPVMKAFDSCGSNCYLVVPRLVLDTKWI